MKAILLCFLILLFSCSDEKSSNKSVGQLGKDSLETGFWQYYSDKHELLEEGQFQNGIRSGTWKYFIPTADTINWWAYYNPGKSIVTNIPEFLEVTEESDSIVAFKHKNPLQLFTLAIGANYNSKSNSFENYKQAIFQDLKSRNVQITDSTSYILEGDKGKMLYTSVAATETNGRKFRLFNVSRQLEAVGFIEVTLRCDIQLDHKGRKVFFSVIPNLFIVNTRFIDTREDIKGDKGKISN